MIAPCDGSLSVNLRPHYRCGCFVSLPVKRYSNKVELSISCEHDSDSQKMSKGILTDKQRRGLQLAVRAAPLAAGGEVHSNLKNFSPGRHVASDLRSRGAVNPIVRKERSQLFADSVQEVDIDGTSEAMLTLAINLLLSKFISKHNNPDDAYH
jgi:hypothetical protein